MKKLKNSKDALTPFKSTAMMPSSWSTIFVVTVRSYFIFFPSAQSHRTLSTTNLRGVLRFRQLTTVDDPRVPFDKILHNPSWDKSWRSEAGRISQIKTRKSWTLFEPMKPRFFWRAGACGDPRDLRNPNKWDHMKGVKYYWPADNPRIVKT